MSHAQANGVPAPPFEADRVGLTLRRCDECGYPTFVPTEDADAHWVVCGYCRHVEEASERSP